MSRVEAATSARRAGLLADARTGFMGVAAAAAAEGDDALLVTAALGVGGLWVHEQRDVVGRAEVRALWERAGQVVPAGSLDAARLAVRVAAESVYEGGPADPVVVAVETVRGFADGAATAEALSLLHHVRLGPRHAETRLVIAEEMIRLAARAGDRLLALMGLCWRTVDLFLLGSPRAAQSLAELTRRSEAEGCEAVGFIADVLGAMVASRAGRFADAEAAATAAAERGTKVGDPDVGAYFAAVVAAQSWWQGRTADVVAWVRELSTSPQLGFNDHVYVATDAALSATLGDADSAEEALARLTTVGLDRLPESSTWLTTQFLVAEAAWLLGDAALAEQVAELVAPYAHLPVMPSLASVCLGSAERTLGLAAATTGRLDAAVHHLDAALIADRHLGNRPMAALTAHTLARVLAARNAPGDSGRAKQLAGRAEERADAISMVLPAHPAWLSTHRPVAQESVAVRVASLQPGHGGWRITVDRRTSVLADRVGFCYLAQLISHPGRDLDVAAIASGGTAITRATADAVVDDEALRSYRRRALQLAAALAAPDLGAADEVRHRTELAAINATVRGAVGLAGRRRVFPDTHERARTAVRKAVIRAVAAVADVEADLGRHLQTSITTGATCRYNPTPGWTLTARPHATSGDRDR